MAISVVTAVVLVFREEAVITVANAQLGFPVFFVIVSMKHVLDKPSEILLHKNTLWVP